MSLRGGRERHYKIYDCFIRNKSKKPPETGRTTKVSGGVFNFLKDCLDELDKLVEECFKVHIFESVNDKLQNLAESLADGLAEIFLAQCFHLALQVPKNSASNFCGCILSGTLLPNKQQFLTSYELVIIILLFYT